MAKYKIYVQLSGGAASYVAAKQALSEFGHDGTALVFADTKEEDEDLYRFLTDVESFLDHPIIRIADGRDLWQVFFDERMMGSSQFDPCSRILKRQLLNRWRIDNCDEDCVLIIGFDANEEHRLTRLAARMAPVKVRAPLIERSIWKEDTYKIVKADGLRLSKSYALGFPHDNCGGFCVKAGQANFALLLETRPDRYARHEAKEEEFRQFVGKNVSIMRDRSGGKTRPLTMRTFRERQERHPRLFDRFDFGGCSCMEEPEPEN